MSWVEILRVGFSGFAFAVLYFGYRLGSKNDEIPKSYLFMGLTLAVLVVLGSFVDKLQANQDPTVLLQPCRKALETLDTHLKNENAKINRSFVRGSIHTCETTMAGMNVR